MFSILLQVFETSDSEEEEVEGDDHQMEVFKICENCFLGKEPESDEEEDSEG